MVYSIGGLLRLKFNVRFNIFKYIKMGGIFVVTDMHNV